MAPRCAGIKWHTIHGHRAQPAPSAWRITQPSHERAGITANGHRAMSGVTRSNTVSGRCQLDIRRPDDSVHVNSSAISASGLRKTYGDKTSLDGIDLRTYALVSGPVISKKG
jgi:hypothetical protein